MDAPDEARCKCPKCGGCRYLLMSSESRKHRVCLSCRRGEHYGRPLA